MTQKLGVITFSKKLKRNPEALPLMNGGLKIQYGTNRDWGGEDGHYPNR